MASVTCHGNIHMDNSADMLTTPGVDIIASKTQLEPAVTEITEKCLELNLTGEVSSLEMDPPRIKRIDPPSSNVPDSPTYSGRPRAPSRSTSAANSSHHSRPGSRNTVRSPPPSRHNSFQSTKRALPNSNIFSVSPPRTSAQDRRESLLAFHRESCRLFQEQDSSMDEMRPVSALQRAPSTTYRPRRDQRLSSELGSAPPSPIASSYSTQRLDYEHRGSLSSAAASPPLCPRDRSNTLPTTIPSHVHSPSESSIPIPATVMEWTSPSTRKQEYEKIDRANRGMRGLWRRVAPRWCQGRTSRMPFFEEGRVSREGSVRRFRMDVPEKDSLKEKNGGDHPQVQFLNFIGKSGDGDSLRRWAYS